MTATWIEGSRVRRSRLCGAIVLVLVFLTVSVPGSANAATPVTKAQREVVIFSPGLAQGTFLERAFYDFVELNAIGLATATLGTRYNTVHIVKGTAATRAGLANTLNTIASKSTVRAVDLVFITHGLTEEVVLADDRWSINQVRDRIRLGLTLADRAKLRMVFSTACFGASHNARWLEAGFKVASGGKRIYADSATSYPAFLGTWALGATFGVAVAAANASDPLRLQDNAAKVLLRNEGFPNPDVDSTRVVSGASSLTIGTMP